MRVVGLHPEDLLDKDARGALTTLERERLDAHMQSCAACRVEQQMRADFASELGGEDPRISVSGLLVLAGVASDEKLEEEAAGHAEQVAAGLSRRRVGGSRRATRATWLLAAAAVFAASVAGAAGATSIGRRAWSSLVGAPALATTLATTAQPAAPRHAARQVVRTPLAPVATVDVLADAPPAEPVRATSAVVAAPSHVRAAPTAASVFEAANDARRRGDYTRSLGLHRELESRFPTSAEAHVSRATTGQLLLDLGDPTGALASFDGYLATGSGELGEEAMVGRANALEHLGRAEDARRAWQALLAAFPDSPYAAHAKRRLSPR